MILAEYRHVYDVVEQYLAMQILSALPRHRPDCDIHFVVLKGNPMPGDVTLRDRHANGRLGRGKKSNEATGKSAPDCPLRDKYPAYAAATGVCHASRLGRLLDSSDDAARSADAYLARTGERDASAATHEHPCSDLLLEFVYLPRQGRLGQVQSLGRANECRFF